MGYAQKLQKEADRSAGLQAATPTGVIISFNKMARSSFRGRTSRPIDLR
jgi:hypothetical protein